MSRKVKTRGKVPSLTELILSQTGKHDHLLTNPNNIRKYFDHDKKCEVIRFINNEHFVEYNDTVRNEDRDECAMKGYKIYNTLRTMAKLICSCIRLMN